MGSTASAGSDQVTSGLEPIRFYFDFASPYGYFAATSIGEIAQSFGRTVAWRPVLLWAVLKELGIAAPVQSQRRWEYLLCDMERSAAFLGIPYRPPAELTISTHRAARLFHAAHSVDPDRAVLLATRIFEAFFVEGKDVGNPQVLLAVAAEVGLDAAVASDAMDGQLGRALLENAMRSAVEDGVVGSPYIVADGEGFFGADRLSHVRWRLARTSGR